MTWDLDRVLDDPTTTTLLCCGSGGVGKTTTAASLALRAAERGRRVVVLTVDPSRRLAQALGLPPGAPPTTPVAVPGVDAAAGGSLDAVVLDATAVLDGLVEAALPPARAEALRANPVYTAVATSFSGTQEYMAMEKLGQLREQMGESGADGRPRWDLVVVDTPPSRSALDFLDAPSRLGRFLDGRFATLLRRGGTGGRAGGRLGGLAASVAGAVGGGIAAVMDKVLGARLLRDVEQLVQGLDVVFGGFQRRAAATTAALREPGTGFVVVTAAEPDALAEARHLLARLAGDRLPASALVVNRVTRPANLDLTAERARTAAASLEAGSTAAELLLLHAALVERADREALRLEDLVEDHPGLEVATAAARAGDVHDLDGLRAVGTDLAGG